jgi:hypothetical protein
VARTSSGGLLCFTRIREPLGGKARREKTNRYSRRLIKETVEKRCEKTLSIPRRTPAREYVDTGSTFRQNIIFCSYLSFASVHLVVMFLDLPSLFFEDLLIYDAELGTTVFQASKQERMSRRTLPLKDRSDRPCNLCIYYLLNNKKQHNQFRSQSPKPLEAKESLLPMVDVRTYFIAGE